jgi:hypothetical protein
MKWSARERHMEMCVHVTTVSKMNVCSLPTCAAKVIVRHSIKGSPYCKRLGSHWVL